MQQTIIDGELVWSGGNLAATVTLVETYGVLSLRGGENNYIDGQR